MVNKFLNPEAYRAQVTKIAREQATLQGLDVSTADEFIEVVLLSLGLAPSPEKSPEDKPVDTHLLNRSLNK
jgi:hypothetical protein